MDSTRIKIITEDEAASGINVLAFDIVLVLGKDGSFRVLGERVSDTHQRIKDDVTLTTSLDAMYQQASIPSFGIEVEGFPEAPVYDVRDVGMEISRGHFEGDDARIEAIDYTLRCRNGG